MLQPTPHLYNCGFALNGTDCFQSMVAAAPEDILEQIKHMGSENLMPTSSKAWVEIVALREQIFAHTSGSVVFSPGGGNRGKMCGWMAGWDFSQAQDLWLPKDNY